MSKHKEVTIDDLIKEASNYIEDKIELEDIKRAYQYAKECHDGQIRKTGEPYIIHPLNTALILTTVYADKDTIIAGLLHDVIEDCGITKEEIEEEFGSVVSKLVYGVSKLGRINFSTENEYLIDYYKKIIVGMSEDVRVIIVKLADRLHNMRTLYALSEDKQKKIAANFKSLFLPDLKRSEEKNFENIFKVLSEYLDDHWFESKLDLLNCVLSLIHSQGKKFKHYANVCLFKILDFF